MAREWLVNGSVMARFRRAFMGEWEESRILSDTINKARLLIHDRCYEKKNEAGDSRKSPANVMVVSYTTITKLCNNSLVEGLSHLLTLDGVGLVSALYEQLTVAEDFDGRRFEACIIQGGCSVAGCCECTGLGIEYFALRAFCCY